MHSRNIGFVMVDSSDISFFFHLQIRYNDLIIATSTSITTRSGHAGGNKTTINLRSILTTRFYRQFP